MKSTGQRSWLAQALIVLVCLTLAGLIGRLAYIHTQMRDQLLAWSQRCQRTTIRLPGRRGNILDRRLRVLAGTHYRPTIYADPLLVEDHADAARRLAVILYLPEEQIKKLLDQPTSPRYVIIKKSAESVEAEGVEHLAIKGIGIRKEPARRYPMGALAGQVLGFVGMDGEGLEGVEMKYDKYLQGEAGRRVVYRDVRRRAMFQEADSYVPPQDGLHIVLTIDAVIQEVVEREVARQVEHFKAENGIGLVMNPQNGEVLAMACVPAFEPAQGGNASPELRRNRILTDPVEPGSIFKPFVMAAAIAEGVAKPSETIDCEGGMAYFGKRRLMDHHPYGFLTVEQILTKSSNIGMAKLGIRLGNDRIYAALRNFGLGGPTGIDLPGEDAGLLMPLKMWNSYSTTSVPMGHELAVTPIQMATAFSALVNGGYLVQPRVVAAIFGPNGQILEDRRDMLDHGPAIDSATAETMHKILVKVVNEGTGKRCQLDKWQVMGKTGTAQVPYTNRRGYEPDAYLGSFMAAAPASDPRLVVLVMVRKPDRRIGYYGSKVALPAVKAILQETLPYLNIPPDKETGDKMRLVWDGQR